jgi:hypothetical protein
MPTQLAASTLHKTFGLRKPAFKNVDKPVKRNIPPVPSDPVKFNELIGLPLHPATLIPSPLLDYQLAYINLIHNHHRIIFNKSRKIGATETALRAICQQCYGDYIGHNVIIVAGNRQDEANIFLERFEDLFIKGWKIGPNKTLKERDLIMDISSDRIDLYSGVTIRTIPANPRALRAQANVKCVFFSEAAHINSLNDEKIWGAVKPIIANDDSADIIVESTPNGCYTGDTDIMTIDGWVNFKELTKNHKVACLINGIVEYHHPEALQYFKDRDDLLHFKSTQIDLMVTKDHRMYTKIQKGPWQIKKAEELTNSKTDLYFKKSFPWNEGKDIESIIIPQYSWIAICRGISHHYSKPEIKLNADYFMDFLGWVLSDGHVINNRVEITQTKYIDRVRKCLINLGMKFTEVPSYGGFMGSRVGVRFKVHSKQLANYMRDYKTKGIPFFIKNCSKRQLAILMNSFFYGDGDFYERRRLFVGIYKKLADDIQEIVLKLGFSSNIRQHGKEYIVTIGKDKTHQYQTYKNPIIEIKEPHDVYCCTVPGGLVFVRRGANSTWCGNCRGFFHDEFFNMENGYFKLQYDYTWALDKLISREFIAKEKRDPRPYYFSQEYECKFVTGGRTAITIPDQAISYDTLIDLDTL